MFYVCLTGKGAECEYLGGGFNYQPILPPRSRAGFAAGEAEPGSAEGCVLGGAGEPQWHSWAGEGSK